MSAELSKNLSFSASSSHPSCKERLLQKNLESEGIYSVKRLNESISVIRNIRYAEKAPTPKLNDNFSKNTNDDNNIAKNHETPAPSTRSSSSSSSVSPSLFSRFFSWMNCYSENDHPKHRLDIYFPNNPPTNHNNSNNNNNTNDDNEHKFDSNPLIPIILKVHGGGWARGDRETEWRGSPSFSRAMAKRGYIVAAISYRLAPPSYLQLGVRSLIGSLLLSLIFYFSLRFSSAFFANLSSPVEFSSLFAIFWVFLFISFNIYFSVIPHLLNRSNYVRYPYQNLDVLQALFFIRKYIKNLLPNADPNNIFLAGHSAGGHLTSLLALNYQQYFQEREKLLRNTTIDKNNNNNNNFLAVAPDESKQLSSSPSSDSSILSSSSFPHYVKGVISISGVYNLQHPFSSSKNAPKNFLFRLFYAHSAFGVTDSILNEASPIWHVKNIIQNKKNRNNNNDNSNNNTEEKKVTASETLMDGKEVLPFLVFSASHDLGLEYDAQRFIEGLKEASIDYQFELIEGSTHASIASRFEKHRGADIVKTFIDGIIKKQQEKNLQNETEWVDVKAVMQK